MQTRKNYFFGFFTVSYNYRDLSRFEIGTRLALVLCKKDYRTMSPLLWFRNLLSNDQTEERGDLILPVKDQIKAWRSANRKMGWT